MYLLIIHFFSHGQVTIASVSHKKPEGTLSWEQDYESEESCRRGRRAAMKAAVPDPECGEVRGIHISLPLPFDLSQ